MAKQYGLTFPKKSLSTPKAGNIFGNDDDSDEDKGTDWVKKALKAENEKNKIKKQTQLAIKKALQQDPTIFKYDEVYDDLERSKLEENANKKIEKKPKYINNLLKSADQRKKEQELRKERMIQKDIEAEEAMFPEKDRFVTSGYKKKLEEMKKFEEEQEKKDKLDDHVEVSKQNDISGFYRHLYRQTVEKNDADLGIDNSKKTECSSNIDKDNPILSDTNSELEFKISTNSIKAERMKKTKQERQYRKRVHEESESEKEEEFIQNETENLIEPSVQEIKELKSDGNLEITKKQKLEENEIINGSSTKTANQDEKSEKVPLNDSCTGKIEKITDSPKEEKKKINIWEKRTVGLVFETALQKYLMRKQERQAGL